MGIVLLLAIKTKTQIKTNLYLCIIKNKKMIILVKRCPIF